MSSAIISLIESETQSNTSYVLLARENWIHFINIICEQYYVFNQMDIMYNI